MLLFVIFNNIMKFHHSKITNSKQNIGIVFFAKKANVKDVGLKILFR